MRPATRATTSLRPLLLLALLLLLQSAAPRLARAQRFALETLLPATTTNSSSNINRSSSSTNSTNSTTTTTTTTTTTSNSTDGLVVSTRIDSDAPPTPPPRTAAATAAVPGTELVVLFGGRDAAGAALGDTWLFDAATAVWTVVLPQRAAAGDTGGTAASPPPRYDALATVVDWGPAAGGPYFYVVGGRDRDTRTGSVSVSGVLVTSLVWALCVENRSWSEVQLFTSNETRNVIRADVFGRAGAAGGLATPTDILISHGVDVRGRARSDTYLVSLTGPLTMIVKEQVHPPIGQFAAVQPHAMQGAGGAVTNAADLVLFGGCYTIGMCPHQDVWLFKLLNRKWQLLLRAPSPRVSPCFSAAFPSMDLAPDLDARHTAILWGGREHGRHYVRTERASPFEVDVLDTVRNTWRRELASGDPSIKSKRRGAGFVTVGNGTDSSPFRFVILGGADDDDKLMDSALVLRFNPNSPPKILSPAPVRFYSHLLVHGIFMGVAFAALLPTGIIVSRYMRTTTSSPEWFKVHLISQCLGAALAWVGLIFVLIEPNPALGHNAHSVTGIIVMSLVTLQLISGLPRIRPNPNAGVARRIWRAVHFLNGWAACIVGSANVFLGMLLILAPPAVWISYAVFLAVAVLFVLALETARCTRRDHKAELYTEEAISYKHDVEKRSTAHDLTSDW